jgi:hypothetical protein
VLAGALGSLGLIGSEEFLCCVELTCMVPRALVVPYAPEPYSPLPIWLSSFLARFPLRAVQPHA